jgi:hypothetical protein
MRHPPPRTAKQDLDFTRGQARTIVAVAAVPAAGVLFSLLFAATAPESSLVPSFAGHIWALFIGEATIVTFIVTLFILCLVCRAWINGDLPNQWGRIGYVRNTAAVDEEAAQKMVDLNNRINRLRTALTAVTSLSADRDTVDQLQADLDELSRKVDTIKKTRWIKSTKRR